MPNIMQTVTIKDARVAPQFDSQYPIDTGGKLVREAAGFAWFGVRTAAFWAWPKAQSVHAVACHLARDAFAACVNVTARVAIAATYALVAYNNDLAEERQERRKESRLLASAPTQRRIGQ